jgi:hypothetical protein
MILYHGTSLKALKSILKHGIRPRGSKKSHWNKCPSRAERVYLTECYAPYFAYCADPKHGVILEIDTDKLDQSKMGTDEDIVGQVFAFGKPKVDLLKVTQELDIEQYDPKWQEGLKMMGNCSYKGVIPPEAIIRYIIIDWKVNIDAELNSWDVGVSIVNYKFLRDTHMKFQRWLFGEEQTPYSPAFELLQERERIKIRPATREGLEVVNLV